MMDMESDRMAHLTLDPKTVESERGVVYSERRLRVDNDNFGALFEQVNATAFAAHPYHWPVIGWPSDIEAWTREDLADYYKQGYAPNNCVMVVVGDISATKVFTLAQEHFERIPAHQTFSEPRTKEPLQTGERVVHIRKQAELPLLLLAFHVPPSNSLDDPPIQLVQELLSTGDSSRLHSRLIDREQLVLNVAAFEEPSLDPYLLGIMVQPRAHVEIEKVRSIVDHELERLASELVSEPELRKAKNQWLAAHYRQMKTVSGRANLLGSYEVFYGSFKRLYSQPDDIEKVTAADIQRVSKELFRPENRTVGILEPENKPAQESRR
jgi:zinc protease